MKPIAIAACCCFAFGLWSCAAATTASDVTTATTTREDRKLEVTAVESAPSLDEMMRLAEIGGQFVSDWIGSIVSNPSADDDPAVEGRGKKMKPGAMAMAMSAAAGMSMMMAKSMGAIMLFIVHSFFVTKLGIIIGAYLLLCKMMEMQKQPPKKVIKWTSPPDEHPPPHMMMAAGGPYPDSQSPYSGDPLQQQPADQYGAPPQQQPSDQYGAPPPQQQYMAPADFGGGGGGGGDIMQAHYSNVSPVTYRPAIKSDNVAKSAKTGRIIRRRR